LDWKKYGYVISSEYRKRVIFSLVGGPKTPKQIAIDTSLHLSHVSQTLKELSSFEIVICLNPELKRGRVYELTKEGREIAKQIKSQS